MKNVKPLALIALLFAVTAELLRALGPLLDSVAGDIGIVPAAGVAIGLFILPGAILGILRRLSAPAIVVLLLIGRVIVQFVPNVALVGACAVLAMVALAVAVRRAGAQAITGVLAGGVLDLAIRSMTVTWDPLWTYWWGLPMVALLAVAVWLSLSTPPPEPGTPVNHRIWVLGCYLALWTTTIGNPAFAASQSGVPLQLMIGIMLAGLALAGELARRLEVPSWALLPVLGIGLYLAWGTHGAVPVVLGLVLAQSGAALTLRSALTKQSDRGTWVYGLAWVLPVLLFQLHYDMPLPFDNRYLIYGTGLLLVLASLGRDAPARPSKHLLIPVALGMLIAASVAATAPAIQTAEQKASFRLMTWNIKYGRDDARGVAQPRQIADAIRQANPDVVVLQEVSRGWAIGGGVDVAEYLARELGMSFYWGPAADGQFGNLLLSRLPVENVQTGQLPFGQGPMGRSYLKARIDGVDLLTTHLTHKKQNTPTRLQQIETVLAQHPDVVAGDLNFWPTWSEPLAFARGGYFSAQDASGYPPEWTSPSTPATNRVDWVFGSSKVVFSNFEILRQVTVSDHLPLITTVSLRFSSP
jgi:endonuclease/exonuclease/phosphatase family metal-dependent hydrolase